MNVVDLLLLFLGFAGIYLVGAIFVLAAISPGPSNLTDAKGRRILSPHPRWRKPSVDENSADENEEIPAEECDRRRR